MILLLLHLGVVSIEAPFNANDLFNHKTLRFIIYSLTESIFLSGSIILTSLRFWHLFYDMKYIKLCAKQRWHQIIDVSKRPADTSSSNVERNNSFSCRIKKNIRQNHRTIGWFLKYKSTLGNYHFTIKIAYCLMIFIPLCLHLSHYFEGPNGWLTITFAFMFAVFNIAIPTIVLVYVKYQLKRLKFEDNFFIGLELTYEFWIWVLFDILQLVVWYTAVYAFDVDVHNKDYYNSTEFVLLQGFATLSFGTVVFIDIYLLTKWVLDKIKPLLHSKELIQQKQTTLRSQKTGRNFQRSIGIGFGKSRTNINAVNTSDVLSTVIDNNLHNDATGEYIDNLMEVK